MSDQSEEAIYRSEMGKVQDDLHHIYFTRNKPWKDITTYICHIKEYVVSQIDLEVWADNMDDSIYLLFINLLVRLQILEVPTPPPGRIHRWGR